MSLIRRRRWFAGLILSLVLGHAARTSGQDAAPALPALPDSSPPMQTRPVVEPSPLARATPPVVQVGPGGVRPSWVPESIDPIALERHESKFVEHKSHSRLWRRVQGRFWGYPENYEPRPLGSALYDNYRVMVAKGASTGLVLYDYDFLPGSAELNVRGIDQLSKFTAQLAASPFPLIVERTIADPALAESRRFAVLARMARGPLPVTSDRVMVGVPAARGLSGPEAQVIAGNSLGRTQQYGPPIPISSNGVNSPSGVTSPTGGAGANGGINP